MVTSAIPGVIDALLAVATAALPGVTVIDGFDPTDAGMPDSLQIGVDSDADGLATAATAAQAWANANYRAVDEEGDVMCLARSWRGEAVQKAARDGAYATLDGLAAALQADPSLGLPYLLWTRFGSSVTFEQDNTEDGALATVTFSIHFRARL
jgi:hypothetical protein